MDEIWRDVVGYENLYQVSDHGNVRALSRTIKKISRLGLVFNLTFKAKNIRLANHNNGYLTAGFANKNHYVHRLVAFAFLENPFGYNEVNHKDFNRKNNNKENLEWCSRIMNVQHSASLGRLNYAGTERAIARSGINCSTNKYSVEQILEIRERYKNGETPTEISRNMSINMGSLSGILYGNTWKYI